MEKRISETKQFITQSLSKIAIRMVSDDNWQHNQTHYKLKEIVINISGVKT
jgi:hypothetical protein